MLQYQEDESLVKPGTVDVDWNCGVEMAAKRRSLEDKKDDLLVSLRQVRNDILAAARRFPAGEENVPFVGIWSLLDLLAHLAGWDVTNRQAAQEILAGQAPSFYAHHSKDWAVYNAVLVNKYRRDTLAEILTVVEQTHSELLGYLRNLPAKDLFADHDLRLSSGYHVIISRLLEAERKDETRHLGQILEFLHRRRP